MSIRVWWRRWDGVVGAVLFGLNVALGVYNVMDRRPGLAALSFGVAAYLLYIVIDR